MKKIHLISLRSVYFYGHLDNWPSYEIFTKLTSKIPGTTHYYVGPFFTSIDEATDIAREAFRLIVGRVLKDAAPRQGPLDCRLGNFEKKESLVPEGLIRRAFDYRWWHQISSQIADTANFLRGAKAAIADIFGKIAPGDECLIFTVFPFGEIICREFIGNKLPTPIFRFLEGFSLIEDAETIRAELIC